MTHVAPAGQLGRPREARHTPPQGEAGARGRVTGLRGRSRRLQVPPLTSARPFVISEGLWKSRESSRDSR